MSDIMNYHLRKLVKLIEIVLMFTIVEGKIRV